MENFKEELHKAVDTIASFLERFEKAAESKLGMQETIPTPPVDTTMPPEVASAPAGIAPVQPIDPNPVTPAPIAVEPEAPQA